MRGRIAALQVLVACIRFCLAELVFGVASSDQYV